MLDRLPVAIAELPERQLAFARDRLAFALPLTTRARVVPMLGPLSAANSGFPCRHFQSAHNKRRSMNTGTNIRLPSGMRSCSDVRSYELECMPDKIAGQLHFSACLLGRFS
jgi:hypothetical protein